MFEDLLRGDDAPNGCSELMLDAAMRAAAQEGPRYATLGMVPARGVGRWMRFVADRTRWLYDFTGLHAFRARLRPTR
ncbi:MAG: phosphatidylglycerol lysyltransferase domain-containing protein [Polyangiales bacterium]